MSDKNDQKMQDLSERARYVRPFFFNKKQDMSDRARFVREICPTELDLSDKNDNKTQDMSDRARYVRQKFHKNGKICPTET